MTLVDSTPAAPIKPSQEPDAAQPHDGPVDWWIGQIDALDHEILRLASICEVNLLEPGVVDRVLHNDESVCHMYSPAGFEKLRLALMMNYALFNKAALSIGALEAALMVLRVLRLAEEAARAGVT